MCASAASSSILHRRVTAVQHSILSSFCFVCFHCPGTSMLPRRIHVLYYHLSAIELYRAGNKNSTTGRCATSVDRNMLTFIFFSTTLPHAAVCNEKYVTNWYLLHSCPLHLWTMHNGMKFSHYQSYVRVDPNREQFLWLSKYLSIEHFSSSPTNVTVHCSEATATTLMISGVRSRPWKRGLHLLILLIQ